MLKTTALTHERERNAGRNTHVIFRPTAASLSRSLSIASIHALMKRTKTEIVGVKNGRRIIIYNMTHRWSCIAGLNGAPGFRLIEGCFMWL